MTADPNVLLIEDDAALAGSLVKALQVEGHHVAVASSGDAGFVAAREGDHDIVVTDMRLPGMGGLDLVARLHAERPMLPIVLMTAHGTAETAIEATKRGAYDYILKPFAIPELIACIARTLDQTRLSRDRVDPSPAVDDRTLLVGKSPGMQAVYKEIGRVAAQNMTVLIRGETGTGKEMVARALWRHSDRGKRPFLAINCAAIPETLLESELFGHEKGSFTGAEARRIGRFEQAHGGTLFLDEIGDISPATQVRLLRVLEESTVNRVGGHDAVKVDVRVVAATHRDLEDAVSRGQFRDDLYYRLAGIQIRLPALRERTEDIPELAGHFLGKLAEHLNLSAPPIERGALERLTRHAWPGNVRELENVLRRALVAARGHAITREIIESALADEPTAPPAGDDRTTVAGLVRSALNEAVRAGSGDGYANAMDPVETELLRQAMDLAGGNQSRVARWLGISRLTLREKLIKHGLKPPPSDGSD